MKIMCRLLATSMLFLPAASFLDARQAQIKTGNRPPATAEVMNMLLDAPASGSDFSKGCLDVTRALVTENDGNKKRIGSQLWLVCSGLQFPLDVEVCEYYRSSLFAQLQRDAQWNLESMDFPLFCKGMEKVAAKQKAEIAALAARVKEEKDPKKDVHAAPMGLQPKLLQLRGGGSPTVTNQIMHVLLDTQISNSGNDAFTKGCLDVTRAIVAENDGNKKRVASQLALVCSGLQLAPDVEICEHYQSSLFSQLQRDAAWNLESLDFPLFCKGMEKVVAEQKATMAALSARVKAEGSPAAPATEKQPASPTGLQPDQEE